MRARSQQHPCWDPQGGFRPLHELQHSTATAHARRDRGVRLVGRAISARVRAAAYTLALNRLGVNHPYVGLALACHTWASSRGRQRLTNALAPPLLGAFVRCRRIVHWAANSAYRCTEARARPQLRFSGSAQDKARQDKARACPDLKYGARFWRERTRVSPAACGRTEGTCPRPPCLVPPVSPST